MKTLFLPMLVWVFILSLPAQEPVDTIPDPVFSAPDQIFIDPEEYPRFPGSDQELLEFLAAQIQYPEGAKKNGIEGIAVVEFVIEIDGSLSDFKIVKDPGGGCGAELLRVMKLMPNWIPAKWYGKPIREMMRFPFRFSVH